MSTYTYLDRVQPLNAQGKANVYQTVVPFTDSQGNLLTRVTLPNGHPATYCIYGYGCVARGVAGPSETFQDEAEQRPGGSGPNFPTNAPSDWEMP
jgi:hypothetical protein